MFIIQCIIERQNPGQTINYFHSSEKGRYCECWFQGMLKTRWQNVFYISKYELDKNIGTNRIDKVVSLIW